MGLPKGFALKTEAFTSDWGKGFDYHVSTSAELREDGLAFFAFEIQRQISSRTVVGSRARALAVRPTTRRFDLDDVGTVLGEHQDTERSGDTA